MAPGDRSRARRKAPPTKATTIRPTAAARAEMDAVADNTGQSLTLVLEAAWRYYHDRVITGAQPLAWAVIEDGDVVYDTREDAEAYATSGMAEYNPRIVALYEE